MRATLIILAILCLGISCEKKRYPESIASSEATFYFTGTVDGSPTRLEAGRNNYYMYSSFEANDSSSSFTGRLGRQDCESCGPELLLVIHNSGPIAPGSSLMLPGSFAGGVRDYYDTRAIMATFEATFNRTASTYEWDFGDGKTGTGQRPEHIYEKAGVYNVCLKITGNNGCVSENCNTYDLTTNGLRSSVSSQPAGQNGLLFSHHSTGTGPFTFEWNFGDGQVSAQPSPLHTYAVQGSYPVTVKIRDNSGREVLSTYNAVTPGDQSSCAANFRLAAIKPAAADWYSTIELTWKDGMGNTFSTVHATPRPEDRFEIISAEEYETNEAGNQTKKVKVKLSATLSDGSRIVTIDDAEAMIGVSYR